MSTIIRIPKPLEFTFDGARQWFTALHEADLLFHPEDDPADIVQIVDGSRTFTDAEAVEIRSHMDQLETAIGHDAVIAAAYPVFMGAIGLLDVEHAGTA